MHLILWIEDLSIFSIKRTFIKRNPDGNIEHIHFYFTVEVTIGISITNIDKKTEKKF